MHRERTERLARCLTLTFPKSVVIGAKNESDLIDDGKKGTFVAAGWCGQARSLGKAHRLAENTFDAAAVAVACRRVIEIV